VVTCRSVIAGVLQRDVRECDRRASVGERDVGGLFAKPGVGGRVRSGEVVIREGP
jgi:hypothetical protein